MLTTGTVFSDLTSGSRLLNADGVTSARVGQLAPPSEQQGEPLPQGDITINARARPAASAARRTAERNMEGTIV